MIHKGVDVTEHDGRIRGSLGAQDLSQCGGSKRGGGSSPESAPAPRNSEVSYLSDYKPLLLLLPHSKPLFGDDVTFIT